MQSLTFALWKCRKRVTAICLAAIVLAATGLSLVWVFRVPIYQAADEPGHLDYALALHHNRGLLRAADLPLFGLGRYVHAWTLYLRDRVETRRIARDRKERVPAGYGTREFFQALDTAAPDPDSIHVLERPYYLALYPYGYYALTALWIGLLRALSDSLVFTFFGCRILSVVLLAFSLVLVHLTAREMGYSRVFALLLTLAIGLFPLTSFVSSYVQPDNLSLTLTLLCWYLAYRVRRRPRGRWNVPLLGLASAALLVTKPHIYLCVVLPIGLMLLSAQIGRYPFRHWLRLASWLIVPAVVLWSVHLWSVTGTRNYFNRPPPRKDGLTLLIHGLETAIHDYYAGSSHASFWGVFGWMDTPLVIGKGRTDMVVRFAIQAATWTFLALTLIRLEQVLSRLLRVARRGRWRGALRIAFSNPVINSYFLFTAVMILLRVRLGNILGAGGQSQGRYWFAFLMPIFLTAISYAPRALTLRWSQVLLSRAAAVGLLLYAIVGSQYALVAIDRRYYAPRRESPSDRMAVRSPTVGAPGAACSPGR
jgi:hypothetical protein